MSFIVCRNCKKFVTVNDNVPLNFDKCQNCGHTLEYAGDSNELNYIMNDIEIPKVAYQKICASCKSLNPRQTGMCLFCGSPNFLYQYDVNSINQYNQSIERLQNESGVVVKVYDQKSLSSLLLKILSIFIGVFDFIFFVAIGLEYTIGLAIVEQNPMLVATQHTTTVFMIMVLSLLLSGFLISFVLPRVSYKESFKLSSLIGIVVGLLCFLVVKDILAVLLVAIVCGFFSGVGGLLGELLVHKILRQVNK